MAELKVKVGGDTSGFAAAMGKVEGIARTAADKFRGAFTLKNIGQTLGQSLLGAVSLGAIMAIVNRFSEFAKGILAVSDSLQVSTDFLQRFQFAAGQVNVSSEDANNALGKLNNNLSTAATEGGEAAEKFRRYGIDIYTASGRVKSLEEVSLEVATAIENASTKAEKSRIAFELLGKGGQKTIAMMKDLRAAMDGAPVASDEDLRAVDALNSKIDAIKTSIDTSGVALQSFFSRATMGLIGMAEGVGKLIDKMQRFSSVPIVGQMFGFGGAMGVVNAANNFMDGGENNDDISFTGPQMPSAAPSEQIATLNAALEKLASVGETAAEKVARLEAKARAAQEKVDELSGEMQTTALGVSRQIEAARILAELREAEFALAKEKEGKATSSKDAKPYSEKFGTLATDIGKSGGFTGSQSPGIVRDVMSGRVARATEQTAQNTKQMVTMLRNLKQEEENGGWV